MITHALASGGRSHRRPRAAGWEVREAVVLFDSAIPGAELEPDGRLIIDLEPGQYRVRATYTKDEDTWMILVQLQPAT
ncbi:Imm21 family immunity protein [Nonomuraea sp. NPDC001636]|uniref:Imm21 family immunity protein n=1 Tax=Nonomuraea sp. NPDC001636 TaxID=3154391 RepID=UPI00331DE0FA